MELFPHDLNERRTTLTITDKDGNAVADQSAAGKNEITFIADDPLSATQFYKATPVSIGASNNANGEYGTRVTVAAPLEACDTSGAVALTLNPDGITPVQSGVSLTSACESSQRAGSYAKLYSFTITEHSFISGDMTSTDLDPYVYLLTSDAARRVVGEDEDNGAGTNASLHFHLTGVPAGTYYVEATTFGEADAGSFNLEVVESAFPHPPKPAEDLVAVCGVEQLGDIQNRITVSGAWSGDCESAEFYQTEFDFGAGVFVVPAGGDGSGRAEISERCVADFGRLENREREGAGFGGVFGGGFDGVSSRSQFGGGGGDVSYAVGGRSGAPLGCGEGGSGCGGSGAYIKDVVGVRRRQRRADDGFGGQGESVEPRVGAGSGERVAALDPRGGDGFRAADRAERRGVEADVGRRLRGRRRHDGGDADDVRLRRELCQQIG